MDLRVKYGATCTILTEYLKATNIRPTQKLATALLYGIKSDTLLLDRQIRLTWPLSHTFTLSSTTISSDEWSDPSCL